MAGTTPVASSFLYGPLAITLLLVVSTKDMVNGQVEVMMLTKVYNNGKFT